MTYLAKRLVPRLVKCKQAGTAGLAALLVMLAGCKVETNTTTNILTITAAIIKTTAKPM